ncbi:MAG: hypothetical protein WC980_02650 [Candidatus Brocadiia bacterium]
MSKTHIPDNIEVVDTELDLSAARLLEYLNSNKNAAVKELLAHYEEIISPKLQGLLPPESAARLGIRMTLGRLQRQGKVKVLRDADTGQDRVCLAEDLVLRNKWISALKSSPNVL